MQRDRVVVGVGLGLVLALLVGVVGYAIWKNNKPATTTKQAVTENVSESGDSLLSVNDQGGITLGSTSDGSSVGLQTNLGQQNGENSNKSGNGSTANLKEYDKYKDAKNALIGDVKVGDGALAENGKKVALLYKGWLTNGTTIDESKPQQAGGKIVPLTFKIGGGQVIAGMEQGVYGMKKGGKRRIIIPPAVGYGEYSFGPIPPNSVLVFDVELVSVE